LGDCALALPPLNVALARALVSRTRVSHLLGGTRELPAANLDALYQALVAVSQLLADIPEIAQLHIKPLFITDEGVNAGQAQIQLSAQAPAGAANFCIRPYPSQLEETVQWQGQTLCLRPIRPEDESLHMAFLQSLQAEDVRMRVFFSKRRMERSELARLVQIDYAREMAFVALTQDADGLPQTVGVVRSMTDPDNQQAEFAVIVRSDLKGSGLGRLLMEKLIRYLRAQGTQRLVANVLKHNERMLKMAATLGFQIDPQAQKNEDMKSIFLALT
jgi:acetyltransferase